MNKLPDISYSLMAQLSYFYWDKIDKDKIQRIPIKDVLLDTQVLSQIKTDFYNDPSHYPKNETIDGKQGTLPEYIYHEEDRRLFLLYSLKKGKDGTPFFEDIIDGWEYLDCATGKIIQNKFFPPELLKDYEESGFFGVAFQRGEDIIIAYRGTEKDIKHNNKFISEDVITDVKIYLKETDIQQVEAVLFYEYIRTKYGPKKNIHITGHSLAGALAQYVHFYVKYNEKEVITVTWNGLGAYGSILHTDEFFLSEIFSTLFKRKINQIDEKVFLDSKNRLKKFYGTSLNELKEKRKKIKNTSNITNYFMDEDFVGGYFNGDWIGRKVLVNLKEKTLLNEISIYEETQKSVHSKIYNEGKITSTFNIKGKKEASLAFHNINNFLVFMGDSGNIMPCVIRQDFRKNALKTTVIKKLKLYNSLVEKGSEIELIKKDTESYNVYRDILIPSNRAIGKGFVVSSSVMTQKDLLFVESFEKENDFKSYDMEVEKEDKLEGKRRYKGKIILGKYNNISTLGGIVGKEPLEIKIYVSLTDEKVTQELYNVNSKIDDRQRILYGAR